MVSVEVATRCSTPVFRYVPVAGTTQRTKRETALLFQLPDAFSLVNQDSHHPLERDLGGLLNFFSNQIPDHDEQETNCYIERVYFISSGLTVPIGHHIQCGDLLRVADDRRVVVVGF